MISFIRVTLATIILLSNVTPIFTSLLPENIYRWIHWHPNPNNVDSHDRAAQSAQTIRSKFAPQSSTDATDLPSYITGASNSNRTLFFPIDYSQQMMHRPEVDLIASYLQPTDVYLEYGSGGSTINFTPLVDRAYSIEHNCEWADFLALSLRTRSNAFAYSHLRLNCVSIKPGFRNWGTLSNFEHANYQQFREYVDVIDSLPELSYDKVFIDGRARLACALKVLPYLKPDSVVFIHDFYARSEHYSAVLQYYVEVARVLAFRNHDESQGPIDEPQGLIVLRRAPNITIPLTTALIDQIYDSIDWRFPFHTPLISFRAYVTYWLTGFDTGRWKRARTPKSLVRLVSSDLFRIFCLYGVFSFVVSGGFMSACRTFALLVDGKSPFADFVSIFTLQRRRKSDTGFANEFPRERKVHAEAKFIETEGMKVAHARRKRLSVSSIPSHLSA